MHASKKWPNRIFYATIPLEKQANSKPIEWKSMAKSFIKITSRQSMSKKRRSFKGLLKKISWRKSMLVKYLSKSLIKLQTRSNFNPIMKKFQKKIFTKRAIDYLKKLEKILRKRMKIVAKKRQLRQSLSLIQQQKSNYYIVPMLKVKRRALIYGSLEQNNYNKWPIQK